LQVLHETIREVIRGSRASCGLVASHAAVRASVLDAIVERVAIQSCPACIANPDCL
jgi:hypothetical protein